MDLILFWFVLFGPVLAHRSKPRVLKTKDKKGCVSSEEAGNDASGEKGSKGTKRKQGWKGWVILEDPEERVQEEQFNTHRNSSPQCDELNARRKSKRLKRD